MKWKSTRNAAENARAELPKLAGKYFKAGRNASAKAKTSKQLHRFRIETKRFRYALELFRPVYGPPLERHLAALRGIQDALGKISDYQTIEEMIGGDKVLEAKLKKSRNRKVKEFRDEWKKFDSGGQLRRWKAFLAGKKRSAKPGLPTANRRKQAAAPPKNDRGAPHPMLE